MATTIGTIELIATIDTSRYKKGAREIEQENKNLETSTDGVSKNGISAMSTFAKVGLGAVIAASVAVGAAIVKNIGGAVSRVDTLNNFPKVMANLGYTTDEASKAMNKLDMGVRGLPTSLDAIASAMQNIAPTTKSLDEATNLTLALNNALLAGGKSADIQATGMEQFSQAIAKGKPDMMEWRSLATAMPAQLKQISNSLGFENWQTMAEAVADGSLSFDKVKESIVALNKDGLGQLPSFAEQAKNATGGLNTGITQMNTAITRGIAGIIQAIGSENINKAFNGIGKSFEYILSSVSKAIPVMVEFGREAWRYIQPIALVVGTILVDAFNSLKASIMQLYETTKPYHEQLKMVAMVIGVVLVGALVVASLAIIGITVVIAKAIEWTIKLITFFVDLGMTIKTTMENAGTSVRNFINGAASWFASLPGRIANTIGNLGSILYGAGRDLIQGLLNGAASLLKTVGSFFASKLPGALQGPFKKALGIQSPSKVFAGYGKNIAEGLAGGVDKYSNLATNAIADMGGEVAITGSTSVPMAQLDKTSGTTSRASSDSAPVTVNLDGIMARSTTDLRDIAKQLVGLIDQERAAKQQSLIMGAN